MARLVTRNRIRILHFLILIKSNILPLEQLIRQSGQIFLIDGNSREALSWLDIVWKEI